MVELDDEKSSKASEPEFKVRDKMKPVQTPRENGRD